MDPASIIGIASGVLAFLQVGGKIGSRVRKLRRGVSADAELQSWTRYAAGLLESVKQRRALLDDQITSLDVPTQSQIRWLELLCDAQGALEVFLEEMSTLGELPEKMWQDRMRKTFKTVRHEGRLRELGEFAELLDRSLQRHIMEKNAQDAADAEMARTADRVHLQRTTEAMNALAFQSRHGYDQLMAVGSKWQHGITRHRKATDRLTTTVGILRQDFHTSREQFILRTEAHNDQRLAEHAVVQETLLSHDARLTRVQRDNDTILARMADMRAGEAPNPGAPFLRICILGIILTLNIELDSRAFHPLSGLSRMNTMLTHADALSRATLHQMSHVVVFFVVVQVILLGSDEVTTTISMVARCHTSVVRGKRRVAEVLRTGRIRPKPPANSMIMAIQDQIDRELDIMEAKWESELMEQTAQWLWRVGEMIRDFA